MSTAAKYELRFTETNSADDSAGKTWGLEGNLFWFVVGGAFATVITLASTKLMKNTGVAFLAESIGSSVFLVCFPAWCFCDCRSVGGKEPSGKEVLRLIQICLTM
jgi:hypothetical protein